MEDNRISSILSKTNLCDRSIRDIQEIEKVDIDFLDKQLIGDFIDKERKRSQEYLAKALDI